MSEYIFQVKNLAVNIGSVRILNNVNLEIKAHSTMVLLGPNGSGKSTLIKAIMGLNGYEIVEGDILFNNKSIKDLSIEERAKMGLGMMFQHPSRIRGVKLEQVSRLLTSDEKRIKSLARHLNLDGFLHRDLNLDLSGGEMKRSELFQLILQRPGFMLLDEPESGVDLENISLMGGVLDSFLKSEKPAGLIITHTGYILDYIEAEQGCVMIDGSIYCQGHPREIFDSIKKFGYGKCKECHKI